MSLENNFNDFNLTNLEFEKLFLENPFGYACDICDRLWFML